MSRSRWRVLAAGATVIVGAATGVLINLITARWSNALGVGLGVLVVIGVLLQVMVANPDDRFGSADSGLSRSATVTKQKARASGRASIIQAGGDVIMPHRADRSSADDQEPDG
jgi:hypothetical protein